jgi:hypothetical protein
MQTHPLPYSWLIPIVVIAIVMALRWRRVGRPRRLRLEYLWIFPIIYLAIAGAIFATATPHGLGWLWCAASLVVGTVVGWWRGKTMQIHLDAETQTLNQVASPAAMIFILGIIVVRQVLREAVSFGGADVALVATDCLVAFALGLLSATRLEMYLRASRLLRQAGSPDLR